MSQGVDLGVNDILATAFSVGPVDFTSRRRAIVAAADNRVVGTGDDGSDLDPWILASLGGGVGENQQVLVPAWP